MSWPVAAHSPSNGHTFLAYVNMTNGNIEVVDIDDVARTTSSPFVLKAALQADEHAGPAVGIRPDGRIIVCYSAHAGATMFFRISTNPYDITAWGGENTISLTASQVTYPNLVYLSGEGAWYLFFRDGSSSNGHLAYVRSTNNGATWSAQVNVYASSGQGIYWAIGTNGVDRIDFAATNRQVGIGSPGNNIYHFFYEAAAWHKSDGTIIGALPFAPTAATLVITSPGTDGIFPNGVSVNPLAIAGQAYGTPDNDYYDLRWTGSAWQNTVIANSGGLWGSDVAPGHTVDNADSTTYIASILTAGAWEMWRYRTPDAGLTWSGTQLTFGSPATDANPNPQSVWQHGPALTEVWMQGPAADVDWGTMGVAA